MKNFVVVWAAILWLCTPLTGDSDWSAGYEKEVAGETLTYHAPFADSAESLLVRSLDTKRDIRWLTAPLPTDAKQKTVTFVWAFGLDVNDDSHRFDFYIFDKKYFSFANPKDKTGPKKKPLKLTHNSGVTLTLTPTLIDKYGDWMGYAFLKIPSSLFVRGRPLELRVAGESADSRSWYMTFKHPLKAKIAVQQEQAVMRGDGAGSQLLTIHMFHFGQPADVEIRGGGNRVKGRLELGSNHLRLPVPAVTKTTDIPIDIWVIGKKVKTETARVKPVKQRTIHLLHHSHVDIGYTHHQDEVKKIQWDHLEKAIELARKTEHYPPGARFRWLVEVIWPMDEYMENASPKQRAAFKEAVQKGWIELGALYANPLTGLCRSEELMRLMEPARMMSQRFDTPLRTAMITDIPGYAWGLVPALAQSGVKYFAIGTNRGHRIGSIVEHWGDRPFYWVSPSGKEKILCWVAGKGYSLFHTGLGYTNLNRLLNEKAVLQYLNELEAADYPYDMVPLHYSIGSDNGPPDPTLPDAVKTWNETYLTPRLEIATAAEAFGAFEKRHGAGLPHVSGDFTGYWEDGAASSARETAMSREASERLIQAETLWACINPANFPIARLRAAWKRVLLFHEHTWGSWNSISDPENEFTLRQWKTKRAFAHDARDRSLALVQDLFKTAGVETGNINSVDVYNTHSHARTDLVILPKAWSGAGDGVEDADGKPVPSQRLSTGELAFLAENIPPLGAGRFRITSKKPHRPQGAAASYMLIPGEGGALFNGSLRLTVDAETGAVSTLERRGMVGNMVNRKTGSGLNGYFYVAGRDPAKPLTVETVKIEAVEEGPLVASLRVRSKAPGCRELVREFQLINGLGRVDIFTTIDKEKNYDPEGVHLHFPFRVPRGVMRMDTSWGVFQPERGQLKGSCKNYLAVQRWVDISNDDYGVTWVTRDAPLVEVGAIAADPVAAGWIDTLKPSQTLYSYVMNNYWETNYLAAQEGKAVFRYAVRPHRGFDASEAERFGRERCQPLIVVPADPSRPVVPSLLTVEPPEVTITSISARDKGKTFIIRLYNTSDRPVSARIKWGRPGTGAFHYSSPYEEKGKPVVGAIKMPAYGITTLKFLTDKNR